MSTAVAKLIIYQAFIEDELEVPKHLAKRVHELYFCPQYKAEAKLAGFLEAARLS